MTDDLISRLAAITLPVMPKEHREYQTFNLDDAYEQGWNDLQKCIELLPPEQPEPRWIPCSERLPERKRGKWMKHNDRACWFCSECKKDNYYAYCWNSDTGKYEIQDHFCPNCGAEMLKGEI